MALAASAPTVEQNHRLELNLRNFLRSRIGREVVVVALEACPFGENTVRKLTNVRVVGLDRIVVALALDGDTIFGARQFVLELQEVLVGF